MEQAVERGLDWVGVAYSTPILVRPRSPHWRRLSDVNAGARFPPAPSVAQSERLIVTPGPCAKVESLPFVIHHPTIEPAPRPSRTRR